jgi:hypothetical protein
MSLGLALLVARLREPINSYPSGTLVAIVPLSVPRMQGTRRVDKVLWCLTDVRRFGERALLWHGDMVDFTPDEKPQPRQPLPRPIEWFFDHEYWPKDPPPKFRRQAWSLEMAGLDVAREYGWPAYCLWEGETVDGSNAGLTEWPWNGFAYGGIRIGPTPSLGRFLPALPLWPGMALDTAFYGGGLLALSYMIPRARRWARVRKGLCPWCRYNRAGLAADAKCPECGRVPTKSSPPRNSAPSADSAVSSTRGGG